MQAVDEIQSHAACELSVARLEDREAIVRLRLPFRVAGADKLFAVPWSALKLDTENKRFVLDVAKDQLESAPGFDQDQWPDMADPTWESKIHSYYGTKPYSGNFRN